MAGVRARKKKLLQAARLLGVNLSASPRPKQHERYDIFLALLREEWRHGLDNSILRCGTREFMVEATRSIPPTIVQGLLDYEMLPLSARKAALIKAGQALKDHMAKDDRRRQAHDYFTAARTKENVERGTRLFTEAEREAAYAHETMFVHGGYQSDPSSLYSSSIYVGPSRSTFNALRKKYGLTLLHKSNGGLFHAWRPSQ